MIRLWLHPRVSLYYPLGISDCSHDKLMFHRCQGQIDLSNPAWCYQMFYSPSDIKIDVHLLNRGFKI